MSVKFGALVVNPEDVADAHVAEKLGFDSIWVAGHMLWPNPTAEVISSLGYLAATTEKAQLGSSILLLPLYSGLSVAKAFAMLQVLSKGRMMLGVGVGGEFEPEFAAAGVSISKRGKITNDQLRLMRGLWHEPNVPLEAGDYAITADAPPLYPAAPPTPILIGGRSPAAMQRAAKLGDGILPYFVTPEKYADLRDEVQRLLAEEGRAEAEFHFATALFVSVSKTAEEGRKAAVDYIRWQYGMDGEPLVDRYAIYGPPDRCAEQYSKYIDAGVRHFVNITAGSGSTVEQLEAINGVANAFR